MFMFLSKISFFLTTAAVIMKGIEPRDKLLCPSTVVGKACEEGCSVLNRFSVPNFLE